MQIATRIPRCRGIGDVVLASSTLSPRPAPPALGTLRLLPQGVGAVVWPCFLRRPGPRGPV